MPVNRHNMDLPTFNDSDDSNPLTPNHLLLLRGNFSLPWALENEGSFISVRTKTTELVRPISKLVFLEGVHYDS